MSDRVRHLTWTGLLLAGLAIVDAAPAPGALWVFGADDVAAQTVQQREVERFLEARRAINAEEFERAVALFQAVRTESPLVTPRFEPDSYYWEAFARYRLGDLSEARLLLEILMVGFNEARPADPRVQREAGRLYHDARALEFEIRSQLASSGDADDAERLLREAEETLDLAATMPVRVMPLDVVTPESIVSLPVSTTDLTALPDSVVADSVAVAEDEPDVQAVQGLVQRLGEYTESVADYEHRVMGYVPEAWNIDWQRRAADIESARAEYQEALRAPSQEACADVSVQLAALEAVMRYENEINRMQVLRDVLARDDECALRLHEETVKFIARQGTEEAETVLLDIVLGHPERSVRRHAIQEMWRFDSFDAFDVLRETLANSDDYGVQSDAVNALRMSRYARDSSGPAEIQIALVDAALDRSKSAGIRTAAIRALSRRDEVGAGVFIPIYEQLDSDDLKEDVLHAMQRKVPEEADVETAAWARSVAFDPEVPEDLREEAFMAWARHPTVTVPRLAGLYGELSEPLLKRQALYAIYERADSNSGVPQVLMELIRSETNQEVRERAIYWLGRTESEEAVDFLLELLHPPAADTVPRKPG